MATEYTNGVATTCKAGIFRKNENCEENAVLMINASNIFKETHDSAEKMITN